MRNTKFRIIGAWSILALAFGTFIVLPGCRTVQGAGQDLDAAGRTIERDVIDEENWR
jgi:predicted small secreted protein